MMAAAGMLALSAGSASALTAAKPTIAEAGTIKVDDRDGMHRHRDRNHMMRRHDDDRRYESYRGWHRYSHRPRDWRTRSCIAVGPFWFCP